MVQWMQWNVNTNQITIQINTIHCNQIKSNQNYNIKDQSSEICYWLLFLFVRLGIITHKEEEEDIVNIWYMYPQ